MVATLDQYITDALERLQSHPQLSRVAVTTVPLPEPFAGQGPVRLIILGQDPTVKNTAGAKRATTVLNLDRNGNLRRYLEKICAELELDLDRHVYATNLIKNFFVGPPAQIKDAGLFAAACDIWLPTLHAELERYPNIPILSLGQPLLQAIVKPGVPARVREYWGYTPRWKSGVTETFRQLEPEDNLLNRPVFPCPHQPSIRKQFYRDRLHSYLAFARESMALMPN